MVEQNAKQAVFLTEAMYWLRGKISLKVLGMNY